MGTSRCTGCGGSGKDTCTSCGGRGWKSGGLSGGGELILCACGGSGKVRCLRCGGTGSITTIGTQENRPTKDRAPDDDIEGEWIADADGAIFEFIRKGENYNVVINSAAGRTGEGTATREGNKVTLDVQLILIGRQTIAGTLVEDRMEGIMQIMGFPAPIVLRQLLT
jgi:hypothetical protein